MAPRILLGIIIVVLIFATHQRNYVWQDDITLWKDVVAKSPNKARAHNNLGRAYGAMWIEDKAIKEYLKAIAIDPNYGLSYENLAVSYGRLGRKDMTIFYYKKALELIPWHTPLYYNFGFYLYSQGDYMDAYILFRRYIQLDPLGSNVPFTLTLLDLMEKNGQIKP